VLLLENCQIISYTLKSSPFLAGFPIALTKVRKLTVVEQKGGNIRSFKFKT
jgi:hypothetical protein